MSQGRSKASGTFARIVSWHRLRCNLIDLPIRSTAQCKRKSGGNQQAIEKSFACGNLALSRKDAKETFRRAVIIFQAAQRARNDESDLGSARNVNQRRLILLTMMDAHTLELLEFHKVRELL